MHGSGDVHLNDDFCKNQGWYSYNVTKGDLIKAGDLPTTVNSSETVWRYDNSQDDQPYTTMWTEVWMQAATASVSVTTAASISLSASFSIPDVGGTSLSVSISSTETQTKTVTDSHELTNVWSITVGPHEILSIDRTMTSTSQKVAYIQKYGIQGLIGTEGDKWEGHYFWAFDINSSLIQSGNPPTGTLVLTGNGQNQSFDHKIIRTKTSNDEYTVTYGLGSVANVVDVGKKKLPIAIPAHNEE